MMYGWWDGGAPWYGMIFGPIIMIGFVVLAVFIVAWAMRTCGLGWRSNGSDTTPLDTLKHRFARGEIDRTEFEERKKVLTGS